MRGRDASEVSRRCTAWGGAETSKQVSRITATAIGQADACAESVALRNYGLVFAQWGLGHPGAVVSQRLVVDSAAKGGMGTRCHLTDDINLSLPEGAPPVQASWA